MMMTTGITPVQFYVYDANNLSATPTKLTAFDAAAGDQFGFSVAATANKIVVAGVADDDNGSNSGSVYVYDINNLSATPTKLTAFDGAETDFFGSSVCIAGDKIFVGAYGDKDQGNNTGAVYVYDESNLSFLQKITAFDGAEGDFFSYPGLAAAGDKLVVSAINNDQRASNAGAVYVYDINDLSAQPTN